MRRAVSWLAVAGLVALGAVATLDALRTQAPSGPAAPAAQSSAAGPDTAAAARAFIDLPSAEPPGELSERSFAAGLLAAAGIAGRLYWSDEDCDLYGYHLPSLKPLATPRVRSCAFSVSSDGWLALEQAVWQPGGSLAATCRHGSVYLLTRAGERYRRFPGCQPAWSPAGELAYVLDGTLRRWPGGEALLGSREVLAAIGRADRARDLAAHVERAIWLGPDRIAALVRFEKPGGPRSPEHTLVIRDLTRNVTRLLLRAALIRDVQASPSGRHLAARINRTLRVVSLDGAKAALRGPALRSAEVRAYAWSPDGRWLVAATGSSLVFHPVNANERRRPRLEPLVAVDLAWLPAAEGEDSGQASASSVTHSRSSPE